MEDQTTDVTRRSLGHSSYGALFIIFPLLQTVGPDGAFSLVTYQYFAPSGPTICSKTPYFFY
jgi:hypothetical protein